MTIIVVAPGNWQCFFNVLYALRAAGTSPTAEIRLARRAQHTKDMSGEPGNALNRSGSREISEVLLAILESIASNMKR